MRKFARILILATFGALLFLGLFSILRILPVLPDAIQFLIYPRPTQTFFPPVSHTLAEVSEVKPIWSIDDVRVLWNRNGKTADAGMGLVCYIGDNKFNHVACFNSLTGAALWNNESGREINITNSGVYVSFSSPAGVRKYDLQNGNLIWRKGLSGTGSLYLYALDDQIQVLTNPEYFWVLNPDGAIVRTETGRDIFASLSGVTYDSLTGLRAYQTGTNSLLWEYIDFSLIQIPVFTLDKIFLRSGDFGGNAVGLDLKTGKLLWKTPHILGNLVYSPDKHVVYALRDNGDLLEIDEDSGRENVIVKFSSVPFLLDRQDLNAFQIAYDKENHVLFVFLGDSNQLFAFQEK